MSAILPRLVAPSAVVLAAFVLCLLPSRAAAAALTVGAQSDNILLGTDAAGREAELDRIKAAGARIVRITLSWDQVAANGPACVAATATELEDSNHACYSWFVYDHIVAEALERGIVVLMSVHQIPDWVLGDPDPYWTGISDAEFDTKVVPGWARLATAAARRYNSTSIIGHVRHWTVGNEPNSGFFWKPLDAGAPKRYARLYRSVAPAIMAANPYALVAPGPTGPRSTMRPVEWLRVALPALHANGSGPYISAWAHNGYLKGTLSPRESRAKSPAIDVTNMATLYAWLDVYGSTRRKPVWLLEYAVQTNPPDKIFGVTWTNQATYLAQGWDLVSDGRTKIAIWYVMRDPVAKEDWQSGLWDQNGARKPSLAMYQRPVATTVAIVRRGKRVGLFGMSLLRPGRQVLKFSYDGRRWYSVPKQKRSGATVRAALTATRSFRVRVVDPAGRGPERRVTVRR